MKDSLPCILSELIASDEYCKLMNFYDILPAEGTYSFRIKIVKWLEFKLNINAQFFHWLGLYGMCPYSLLTIATCQLVMILP